MSEQSSWLVERYWNGTLVYWTGKPMKTSYGPDIKTGWSKDANEALRFSREEDAWTILSWSLDSEGRVAQHMFGLKLPRDTSPMQITLTPEQSAALDAMDLQKEHSEVPK